VLNYLERFVKEHQGKYHCSCGCNQPIVITKNHYFNGIPDRIRGHRQGVKSPLPIKQWIITEQGKYRCQCGCNQLITVCAYHRARGVPKYIHGHQARVRKYPSEEIRFWAKVEKGEGGACWKWLGCKNNDYGMIRSKQPSICNMAHRLSYTLHYGKIPDGLDVLHKCDNPECTNPDHLFLGTHQDNMLDAAKKGRLASKLTDENVREIMLKLSLGEKKARIAEFYGIKSSTLSCILSGKSWSHVTGIKYHGSRATG